MTARGDRTKALLIRATTELVTEVGYHLATTRAVAQRAGVSEGTIYRHFPDKRALFTAAVLAGQQGVTEWIDGLPARAGTAPLPDILTETFTQLSLLRSAVIPLERVLAAEPELRRPPPADLGTAVAELGGPPHLLAEYLRAEQDLGRVDPQLDPLLTAILLLATLHGAQTSPLAEPDGLSPEVVAGLVSLVVRGIAV